MKNNKLLKVIVSIVLVIFIAIGCYFVTSDRFNDSIELTQLTNNTSMQMMGYFIKTQNGKVIVVDGGNIGDSSNLINYINSNGGKVDYWFLTHFHTDHTGAISDIIDNTDIQIDNIIHSFCDRNLVEIYEPDRLEQYDIITSSLEKVKENIIIPVESQVFDIDNVKIEIISVYQNDIFENLGNNTSMVFKLNVNDKSVIFLGDTGKESSEKLLNIHLNDLKSDYVQMAHHGQDGATYELYQAIDPDYCLWPTPDWLWDNNNGGGYNSGPWKTIETREWMENLNVKENYIEKDGNITLKIY